MTRTAKTNEPSRSEISITLSCCARQREQYRRESPLRLPRSQFQNRGSCPSTGHLAAFLFVRQRDRAILAVFGSRAAPVLTRRNREEWPSSRVTQDVPAWRCSPPVPANPLPARHFSFLRLPDAPRSELSIAWLAMPQPRRASGRAQRYPLNPRDEINLQLAPLYCFGGDQSDATSHPDPPRSLASTPIPARDSRQSAANRVHRRNESLVEE